MRPKALLLILFICISSFAFSAGDKWDVYEIVDTIPIKKVSQKKLFKEMQKWFKNTHATKLVRLNENSYEIQGKSYFVYYNRVKMEDIFLSPRAGERTTGSIQYIVDVKIEDSIVIARASNFSHEAYYSPYGQISFGMITAYETVPPGKCMENKLWCNAVWADMKEIANQDFSSKVENLVPDIMVRREGKNYKVKEEEVVDTVQEVKDPKDYLNLDNYIIKEPEEEKTAEE